MKICIIGPSKKFISGISYFTISLANAMSKEYEVSVVTLRNLLPKFLFPGNKRIGDNISNLNFNKNIRIFDGVDWYWIPNLFKAIKFIKKENPNVIILQWWTSSAAHTYWILKLINKFYLKKKIIIEFHETLDPLEENKSILRFYVKFMAKRLFDNKDAYVTHSNNDKNLISKKYNLNKNRVFIVPHGAYDHFFKKINLKKDKKICNLLFFGLIRPYKGVEYLIEAFNKIPKNQIDKFRLYICGETWEGCDLNTKIKNSKYKNRIKFINKYLSDDETNYYFNLADVVVLPYLRASQSGAAHIAISYGLPVICSKVGGLSESMNKYEGTIFVRSKDTKKITQAILKSYKIKSKIYANPHPWSKTIEAYKEVLK
ncbi:MAG: glycosyltransferase [archaeon]